MHKLELASLLERNACLQKHCDDKESLLQEVIANFKTLRDNMTKAHTIVKDERDTFRKRIMNLEMQLNKSGTHQDFTKDGSNGGGG